MILVKYIENSQQKLHVIINSIRQNTLTFVLFLITINIIIKSYNIYENSLHTDEVHRIYWATQSYNTILEMSKNETNPPFYLWLLHTWYKINGNYTNEVHSRYLSLIFSVLTSVIIFYFGRCYFNYMTGVIASLLFSVNPVQVGYSHNISAYTMITFLFVLSLHVTHLFFVHFDKKRARILYYILIIFIDTILIYTHYFVVFGLIAQFVMAVFEYKKNKKAFFQYLLSQVISVILFLPWVRFMLANAKAGIWMPTVTWSSVKGLYIHFIGDKTTTLLFIVSMLFTVIFNFWIRKIEWKKVIVSVLVILLPVLGVALVCLLFQPFWVYRYMLYLIPGIVLLISYLISVLPNLLVQTSIASILFFVSMSRLDLNPITDAQIRQLTPVIAEEVKKPGTLLVINAGYMKYTFAYYFYKYNQYVNEQKYYDIEKMNAIFISSPEDIKKIYDNPNWSRLVYLQMHSHYIDPNNQVMQRLLENLKLEKQVRALSVDVTVFKTYDMLWKNTTHNTIFTSFEDGDASPNISKKVAKSGQYSAYSNPQILLFNDLVETKTGDLYGKKGKVKISAWIYIEPNTKVNFVISLFNVTNNNAYVWRSANIDYSKYNQWQKVELELDMSEIKSDNDIFKCYLEAFEGNTAYVDDLRIEPVFEK